MTTIAYLYSNSLLETPENPFIWGLEVERVYQDIDNRENLQQLIKNCQENPPEYLLIRRLEELGESLTEITETLKIIESLNIEIIAIEQPYNSSQFKTVTSQQIKDNLTHILQQIQQNQRSQNLRLGHARNRLNSLPPPGATPYGYRRGKDKYIIDRSLAPIVKDFFDRFLLYGSLRDSVKYLELKYGKKIAVSTGRYWLTNPVYRGDLIYQNEQTISNTHTPIITREEAAQIDRLLRRNRILPSRSASVNYSLAGLVSCQKCQSKMKINRVTKKNKKADYLYLTPVNCTEKPSCKSLNYAQVLEQIINNICLKLPQAVTQLNLPSPEALKLKFQTEINNKQNIIEQLPQLIKEGIFDEQTALIRAYKLRTEIAQIQAKIYQLPPVNLQAIANTVSIPQFWLDLSETERRFYFREFIKEILIIPSDKNNNKNWQLQLIFIF